MKQKKYTFLLNNLTSVLRIPIFSNAPQVFPILQPRPLVAACRVTDNCNSKCEGCIFHKSTTKDLSVDIWEGIFKQLVDNNFRKIRFTGGEPMMRKDIFELIRLATSMGLKASMQSNILLLNEDKIIRLIESGLDNISFSIDGVNESYKDYRGVDSFEKVKKLTVLVKKHFGVNASITPTIMDTTLPALYDVINFSKEMQVPISGFNLVNFTHYFFADEAGNSRASYENLDRGKLSEFIKFLKNNKSNYLNINSVDLYTMKRYFEDYRLKDLPCINPTLKLCIESDGCVYGGCCSMPPVGNMLDSSLRDILNSVQMKEVVTAGLKKTCPGCSCGLPQSSAVNIKYRMMSKLVGA